MNILEEHMCVIKFQYIYNIILNRVMHVLVHTSPIVGM